MAQVDLDDLETDAPEGKSSRSSRSSSSRTKTARSEKDLRDRLNGCLERIAATLEERGDEQLADVLREDAPVMAQGLVSLTRPFVVLRTPLLALLAIIEPALAFGRVVRIGAERWAERRAERKAQREQAEQEAAAQESGWEPVPVAKQ